jgi:transcriptional regulator with XRE-family HTH domain
MKVQEMMDRLGFRTKQQLADKLEVSQGLVSQWASGKSFPSYQVIKRLLELGATTEELFGVDCRPVCPHAVKQPPEDAMASIMRRLDALESRRLEQPNKAG